MCTNSEEIGLTERTVALVAGSEPFADAGDVELVLAVLAGHAWEALVSWVEHTVANAAVFNSFDLFVDVGFPEQDS